MSDVCGTCKRDTRAVPARLVYIYIEARKGAEVTFGGNFQRAFECWNLEPILVILKLYALAYPLYRSRRSSTWALDPMRHAVKCTNPLTPLAQPCGRIPVGRRPAELGLVKIRQFRKSVNTTLHTLGMFGWHPIGNASFHIGRSTPLQKNRYRVVLKIL